MILKEMFETQKKLDEHINKNHKIKNNTIIKKTVSLIVELSECANEIRFFKFWSNKGPSSKEVILEEYVDVIHFALSIANSLNSEYIFNRDYVNRLDYLSLELIFLDIINTTTELYNIKEKGLIENKFIELLEKILGFGSIWFSFKEIETAYYKKNAINHNRQNNGY
ncbi:dUTP diphosphatase [Clostridium rectalis]|uniref:dUTP diphosphatase n=1 Tax=Clostridium rectalis TaxID=2040295 RepID=UPI000F630E75|nr:dUTP diphosphatase [Clostridium rectalis]